MFPLLKSSASLSRSLIPQISSGKQAICFLTLMSLFAGGLAKHAFAQTTIHVPTDVSSIQGAIDQSQNGDTILVSPGTYTENLDFKGKAVTVTTGARSFTDSSVAATILNGASDGPVVSFHTNEPASGTVLNGFTIQGGHASPGSGLNGGGISISAASPTISNNIVTDNIGCGVLVYNGASPVIENNDIKGNRGIASTTGSPCLVNPSGGASAGSTPGTGLALIEAGDVQVIGNTVESNIQTSTNQSNGYYAGISILKGGAILVEDNIIRNNQGQDNPGLGTTGQDPPKSLTLIQNLIYGNITNTANSSTTDQVFLSGTLQAPFPLLVEVNNTIYGGGEELLGGFSAATTIANNIFVNTLMNPDINGVPNSGIWCDSSNLPFPVLDHNDIFNAGTLLPSGCPLGSGNLAEDPQFLNPGTNDLHTQRTSPVVATGNTSAPNVPSADLDRKARAVDGTIDMGVYEVRPHPPIALAASPNPASGQSRVTLTAVLTSNQMVPTGTITFLDGNTVLGTSSINGSGIASFSTSFLFVGTHNLTASYGGDFNFDDSTSNSTTEVITGPPTTTVLNAVVPNPARPLQAITMTATVSSTYTVPTGNLTFMAGANALATVPVGGNGAGIATVSTLRAGTYSITAVYGGSTQYAASTSNATVEKVVAANTGTTLTASPNSASPGQAVTLTALVSGAQSGIPLTGIVTFKEGATILGIANVGTNGIASIAIATLLTGTHIVTATYGGSSDYNASASASLAVNITAIPTTIGLNVSPSPATLGQNLTMTATVVSSLPNQIPTGTITFSDQSGNLATTTLVSGVASFSTTVLSVGSHQITATLNPTGLFGPSTSPAATEIVNDFNFALSVSKNSLTLPSGDYQNLTVTVTPSGGFPDAVKLACSSVPEHAQCVFKPATTKPLCDGVQTIQLTVNTSDVLGYGNRVGRLGSPNLGATKGYSPLFAGILFPFGTFCGFLGYFSRRSSTLLHRLLLWIGVAALGLGLQACNGRLPGETPPGAYTITVTATDTGSATSLTHSADLHLTVKPKF